MSNPVRGEYDLAFLDPPRKWKITMNEEAQIEADLEIRRGQKVGFDAWLLGLGNWTAQDWRMLLWAGCRHYDKTLTEEQAGEGMTGPAFLEFKVTVMRWFKARYPDSLKKNLDAALAELGVTNDLVQEVTRGTKGSASRSGSD